MRPRTIGLVLIAIGRAPDAFYTRGGSTCTPPALPDQTVDVILSDMGGGMMESGRMTPAQPAGSRCTRTKVVTS